MPVSVDVPHIPTPTMQQTRGRGGRKETVRVGRILSHNITVGLTSRRSQIQLHICNAHTCSQAEAKKKLWVTWVPLRHPGSKRLSVPVSCRADALWTANKNGSQSKANGAVSPNYDTRSLWITHSELNLNPDPDFNRALVVAISITKSPVRIYLASLIHLASLTRSAKRRPRKSCKQFVSQLKTIWV